MKNESENKWHQLIEALAEGVVVVNQEGTILYVNQYAAQLFGKQPMELTGTNFLYPVSADETQEIEIFNPSHGKLTVQMTVREGAWKDQFSWIISLQDISDLKAKEKSLKISSLGIGSAFEGIIITDAKGIILEANRAFLRMTGFKEHDVIGKNPKMLHSGEQNKLFYKHLWEALLEKGHWSGEMWDKRKEGKLFPVFVSISVVKNEAGDTTNYIGFYHDLTVLKKQQKQIEHVKYYDLLTGLPNKFLLTQRLERYMQEAANLDNGKTLIILSIRIFDPATQYSSYGEDATTREAIILDAVDRIDKATFRKEFIARIGYSEFVVIYYTKQSVESIANIAQNSINQLSKPFVVSSKTFHLNTIIGFTIYKKDLTISAEEILHHAEIARHKAKQRGSNCYDFFSPETEIKILEFNQRVEAIRQGLKVNQFELFYQPKVDLNSEKIIGLEALLRWQHPEKGLLSPDAFLTEIDAHPVSEELGNWALDTALAQAEELQRAKLALPISLNISAYQLQSKAFSKNLDKSFKNHPHLSGNMLMLEVLETEALRDLNLVSTLIEKCKAKGIVFALDDFGTGYSSLTYLKKLDVIEVKLDQSFIREILSHLHDLAILRSTISLCEMLGHRLVAEGVETMIHGKLLYYLGCNHVQGYAIAKPMPAKKLLSWIKNWSLGEEWKQSRFSEDELDEIVKLGTEHALAFRNIGHYIYDSKTAVKYTSSRDCPITKWLDSKKNKFQNEEIIKCIKELHEKEHHLGNEIINLVNTNQKAKALTKFQASENLRKKLLKTILVGLFET